MSDGVTSIDEARYPGGWGTILVAGMRMGGAAMEAFYMFIGYRTSVSGLGKDHIRMIESYEETKEGVKFSFTRAGTELTSNVVAQLKSHVKAGRMDDSVWVTPGLPFMIPITAGFITAVVFEIGRASCRERV